VNFLEITEGVSFESKRGSFPFVRDEWQHPHEHGRLCVYAFLSARSETRLPHLTNWQIPQVTPAAWKKTSAPLQQQAA